MKLVIMDEVFAMRAHNLDIVRLVLRAQSRRFRVVPEDFNGQGFSEWRSRLPLDQVDDYDLLFQISIELDARMPSDHSAIVWANSYSNWTGKPASLSISDAIRHAARPFSIVVENRVTDRAFILAVVPREVGAELADLEQSGELQYENGGGLSTMSQTLGSDIGVEADIRFRKFFLFDSDALRPSVPSKQSEVLRGLCVANSIPHYQLRRRAIENYIPCNSLRGWVHSSSTRRRNKAKTLTAYVSLNAVQQAHFCVKHGFEGRAHDDEMYADLTPKSKQDLGQGFGPNVAEIFQETNIDARDLSRHGVSAELADPLAAMLRKIC